MSRPPEIDQMREKRREKMMAVFGVEELRVFIDTDGQLRELVDRLSNVLDSKIELKMMGITVTLRSVSAGRHTYLWMTARQGDERYVCAVWPRPLFSEGVMHYATSETFINRLKMTLMMVSEDQIDFD